MSSRAILRITGELAKFQKDGSNLSLAVHTEDSDIREVRALIIGPPETPYEFGFFEFKISFGNDYPTAAPKVKAITTNGGLTRFNPNIYANGKVCLSTLGTWHGERGEEWSSAQGLESILLSIQSLMSANPYENEPGFEDARPGTDKRSQSYAAKIQHETLRISVIIRLEELLFIRDPRATAANDLPPEISGMDRESWKDTDSDRPFSDLYKRRFLWYFHAYLQTIKKAREKYSTIIKDNSTFTNTEFESGCNGMNGKFEYTCLERRLHAIKNAIDQETEKWIFIGAEAFKNDSPVALAFEHYFATVLRECKQKQLPVELEKEEENPFVWRMAVFGQPMTNLDGGVFNITIVFSKTFPEEQPRVTVGSPLFHHRVSPEGNLCYFPTRPADVRSHIDAILEAIRDEAPSYDPRTMVNPEASKLLWGTPEERKLYNRKLRRSVQESSDM